MSELMQPVEVKYIGKREPWFDRLYDTGLSFTCGQTRKLPWDLAPKFLRHIDLFEEAKQAAPKKSEDDDTGKPASDKKSGKEDEAPTVEPAKEEAPVDDTKAIIDEQSKKTKEKDDKQFELQALYDQVNNMDKDALKHFAEVNYQQKLNKSKSEDNLRAEVISMIDQFGAV